MSVSLLAKVVLLGLVLSGLASPPSAAARAGPENWVWPLDPVPQVVRGFEPPDSPYGPGHRGVDLAGTLGQPVLTMGPGRVTFAGSVGGRGVVVVDHGALRSTYQPVFAAVRAGATVAAGQRVGSLEAVHSHCLPGVCLHLWVLRGDTYVDPLPLLGPRAVRLKPLGGESGSATTVPLPPPRSPPGASPPPCYALGWACW